MYNSIDLVACQARSTQCTCTCTRLLCVYMYYEIFMCQYVYINLVCISRSVYVYNISYVCLRDDIVLIMRKNLVATSCGDLVENLALDLTNCDPHATLAKLT